MAYQIKYLLKKITWIIAGLAVLYLNGCYYDNEEELYPVAVPCDTVNVSFAATVKPIIDDNCVTCHSGQAPSGNVRLESYADIAAAGAIEPGSYGSLYGTINHAGGNSPMPKGGGKLPECSIAQVKAWIDAGMPNN